MGVKKELKKFLTDGDRPVYIGKTTGELLSEALILALNDDLDALAYYQLTRYGKNHKGESNINDGGK